VSPNGAAILPGKSPDLPQREARIVLAVTVRAPSGLPVCQLPTGSSPCASLSANSSIMLRSYSSIVSTEPMDACNALTAPSEGVRRGHVNGVGVAHSHGLHVLTKHVHHPG
jgi:hypothetical protein